MEQDIAVIEKDNIEASKTVLQNLFTKNKESYSFPEIESPSIKLRLWSALIKCLKCQECIDIHHLCLMNIRVLSREKSQLIDIPEEWITTLIITMTSQTKSTDINIIKQIDSIRVESLMCLCNMIHNSEDVRKKCIKQGILQELLTKLHKYIKQHNRNQKSKFNDDVKHYEMKLLFIITALDIDSRATVRDQYGGFEVLNEYMKSILNEVNPSDQEIELLDENTPLILNDTHVIFICEILKTLFNLVMQGEEFTDENYELVTICRCLIFCQTPSNEKKNQLHNDIVNILTCLEPVYYAHLTIPSRNTTENRFIFDKLNVKPLHSLLEFLQNKLAMAENVFNQDENLSPILTVLYKTAVSSNSYRKYLRMRILPPLVDVHSRPEVGNTLRNQLCRLLTTPIMHVRDLNAHFLFVLCKENVGRMVKYTGYGNAAGLFASRGLLGPGKQCAESAQYSSDSEDSDTDEYLAMKHTVNPVTGCYEPPRPDPMAGCTEEQKEHEAMKLVTLMDQLNRAGVIQPCRVGPDGRPEPVEHVLQLQEDLPNQQVQNH